MHLFKKLNVPDKTSIPPIPRKVWRHPIYFIGFGFGSGAMPFAPGTFGTLMAIPFYLLCQSLPLMSYLMVVAILILVSSWICEYLSKQIEINDHPGMCIDELAGFFVTMINAPVGWPWVVLGFLLFRFFDIIKPWPIRLVDRNMHNGFGMVLDDVLAGVFSLSIIQMIAYLYFKTPY